MVGDGLGLLDGLSLVGGLENGGRVGLDAGMLVVGSDVIGSEVGVFDGLELVGELEGLVVGSLLDGEALGSFDGEALGFTEGEPLGLFEGDLLGAAVVGASLGLDVGQSLTEG